MTTEIEGYFEAKIALVATGHSFNLGRRGATFNKFAKPMLFLVKTDTCNYSRHTKLSLILFGGISNR